MTPLTETYRIEIIRRADNAADLPAARDYFVKNPRLFLKIPKRGTP